MSEWLVSADMLTRRRPFPEARRDNDRERTVNAIQAWLAEHGVEYVETFVSDFAGVARGKIQPAAELGDKAVKLPIAIFGQTVTGTYHMRGDNARDRDMDAIPDPSTLRLVPWASQPTACILLDCFDLDGTPVDVNPRAVLRKVVSLYAERGWTPVVAPEVEFYLLAGEDDTAGGDTPAQPDYPDPYGVDQLHELADFFDALKGQCEAQGIGLGAVSQELGRGQFEVNFQHGDPIRLADDVFHFKRTLKHVAAAAGMHACFLAKMRPRQPGSALHIHQSVYDESGRNIFATADGGDSAYFRSYIAGLQAYTREALLLAAPYSNSYRRFLSYWASPVNLEWGIDNRTVGLRVPVSAPEARRVENRVAGADVNPYLAIAGTLACGYLGMVNELEPRAPVQDSAYDAPFALHRHFFEALDAFRQSDAMREMLGEHFVRLYSATKEQEHRDLEERIPDWERDELGAIV
jgi:glutamine synthetase